MPPQYIQSEFAAAAHPLRATADLCRRLPFTGKTMQVNVPAFTSGSAVGIDSTQDTTIIETDPTDVVILSSVTTIAGKATASRQLIDQASADSRVDEILSSDIGAAYGAQLDSAVPEKVLLDVRECHRLNGRPMQLPTTNPAALGGTADDGVVAEWLGMKVILDVNVPITSGNGSQDYVILGHSPDCLLYEGPLNFQVFRETLANQMSVVLLGWQYAALAVRYPSSVCLVGPFNAPTTPGS